MVKLIHPKLSHSTLKMSSCWDYIAVCEKRHQTYCSYMSSKCLFLSFIALLVQSRGKQKHHQFFMWHCAVCLSGNSDWADNLPVTAVANDMRMNGHFHILPSLVILTCTYWLADSSFFLDRTLFWIQTTAFYLVLALIVHVAQENKSGQILTLKLSNKVIITTINNDCCTACFLIS